MSNKKLWPHHDVVCSPLTSNGRMQSHSLLTLECSKCNSPSRLWHNMWFSGNMWWEHFCWLTFTLLNNNININDNDDNDDPRLDGGDNKSNNVNSSSSNNNDNYYWGSRCKCVLSPRYVFPSSNMLTYTPGVARHNTGNWPKMHMRRLRGIASLAPQVSFLFFFQLFFTQLMIIYKLTCMEQEQEPQWCDGLARHCNGRNNGAGRCHHCDFFFSFNFKNTNGVSISRTTVWFSTYNHNMNNARQMKMTLWQPQ